MRARLALLPLSLALLAGCAAVGPDFVAADAPRATGYLGSGEAAPAAAVPSDALVQDWWRLLGSPEIDTVVRQALAGNRSLQATQAALDQARNAVQARDRRLTGSASASAAEERVNLNAFGLTSFPGSTETSENPTFELYSFGASGRYDFDLFGQKRRQHEALLADVETRAYETEAARLTLSAQVVGQAIEIASLRAQIAAAEEIVASDRDNLDLVRTALRLGSGTRLDVATVETELAADEGQIAPLRQRLSAARHALALLAGQAPADWSPPAFALDLIAQPGRIPVAVPSELVRHRPDIRAAEARLHAATARIGVAEADLYPKLELDASFTQGALRPFDLFSYDSTAFHVGPGLSVPILGRAQGRARTRMAEDAARGALASYRQTVLQAFVQVADSLDAITHDDQAIADAERAARAAADALRLQRLLYANGKAALLPVLDAKRSHARAEMALIRARAQRLHDCAGLLYAVSRGWSAPAEPGSLTSG